MRITRIYGTTIRTSLALFLAALAYTTAAAKAPVIKLVRLAPTAGGVVVFEPQAPRTPGGPPTALLNLDITIKNSELKSIELKSIAYQFTYGNGTPQGGALPAVIDFDPKKALKGDESPFIPAGAERKVMLPSAHGHRYPLPTAVTVELRFAGFTDPFVVNTGLGEYKNQSATGSYRFPGRAEDLEPGEVWYEGGSHIFGALHRPSDSQRHAYDLGVRRWDANAKAWTKLRRPKWPNEVVDGKLNDHLLIYGRPVHAVAAGKVVRCWRDAEENPVPGVKHPEVGKAIPNGGNGMWVDHGNGEFALYAHFQKNSVPPSLCPTNGDINSNNPTVKAGDFIGRAGNSGSSSGPHLHFHVQDGSPTTGQGVPALFHGIRTSTNTNSPDAGWVSVVKKSPPTGPVFIEPYKITDKILTSMNGAGDGGGSAPPPRSNRARP